MRGKHCASLAGRCRKKLKEAELRGELVLIPVDEYFSSQVCSNCRQRDMANVQVSDDGTLHTVKTCKR